jgi:glyoxylase-like metal-dependent hydrolase (beta-lactamase superfamily II)
MSDNHLNWTIGDVEVIQIIEMAENDIFSSFIPAAKPEKILAIDWLQPHFADQTGNLKALVQSFLIKSQGKNILIDTCNGNHKNRPNVPEWGNLENDFLTKFTAIGITPEDIDIVACTHLHFDHVGWNTQLKNGQWVPTFPNAQYLFSQKEYDYWIKKPAKELIDDLNGIDDSITPVVNTGLSRLVSDDFQIDDQVYFLPTPGHTPHHISIVIESNSKKAIISGDVLHHPCQMVHPDWTTLADTYPDQTVTTRKQFLQSIKDTDTLLIGSHFANPVAGKVASDGEKLVFRV